MTRCFQCHATAVKPGPDLNEMQPGVTCERCHGPGAAHVEKPSAANIVSFTRRNALESVQSCAECHRLDTNVDDPASIRFQPVGLTASLCFQASGTLSCVTCHDPHTDASHDQAFYMSRCLSCHETGGQLVRECGRSERRDCLPCHMKKESPFPFLTFTDHRIRVNR